MTNENDRFDLETKPFLEHLEDLRWVLIKSLVVLVFSMVVCAISARWILKILYVPLRQAGIDSKDFLRTIDTTAPFTIHMEISFFGGLVLSLPFLLYFVGKFLLPALTPREKRFLLPVFSSGACLFVGGVIFCYTLVLRSTILFLLAYNRWMGFEAGWTASSFIDLEVQMLVGFGVAFEFPLVLIVLNFLGIVPAQRMASYRRYAFVGIFAMVCCITPSTDIFTLMLFSAPMYLLYELSIVICRFMETKRAQSL